MQSSKRLHFTLAVYRTDFYNDACVLSAAHLLDFQAVLASGLLRALGSIHNPNLLNIYFSSNRFAVRGDRRQIFPIRDDSNG